VQGGTYAGNAVACAAAIACAEVMKEENILSNVQERWVLLRIYQCALLTSSRSKELFAALAKLREDPAIAKVISDVRGVGLMVGVEFVSPTSSVHDPFTTQGAPQNIANRVSAKCLEKGMLLLTTSVFQVVRFIPPLNISKEEMEKGCQIFKEAVEEVVREG
jgi:4-aminobutyrate aminotransferase